MHKTYRTSIAISIFAVFFLSNSLALASSSGQHQSKYSGQQNREIKSLSVEDIDELQNGRGWGLAKAAELNGMPGPSHILQMKQEINLTAEQEQKIQQLFSSMKTNAIKYGAKLIALEKNLNLVFANKSVDETILKNMLDKIEQTRKELRYVHLSTHLATPKILTAKQIALYNELRGYATNDPCAAIPKGHDAARWKKHNNCA